MKNLFCPNLQEKVCVITGGGGIIGSALARGIASAGANLAILARNQDRVNQVAAEVSQEFGITAIGVSADVLKRDSLEAAKERIHQELGPIDYLVNCAGGNSPKATTRVEIMEKLDLADLDQSFLGLTLESFQDVINLNFLGTVLPIMVFIRDMIEREKGVILNISSMGALRPLTKIPAYSAAKASVNNFTAWLAIHFAKLNIRVNAIAPGFILTEQNRYLLIDEKTGELTPRAHKILRNTPIGKFGEPNHLCGAALYLLSDMSEFVTGVVMPVDGGFSSFSGV